MILEAPAGGRAGPWWDRWREGGASPGVMGTSSDGAPTVCQTRAKKVPCVSWCTPSHTGMRGYC